MPFLKLGNPDIDWTVRIIQWRQWDLETALTTINQVEIINSKNFIQQVVHKLVLAFIYYIVIIENCLLEIHLSQIAQISVATTEPIILPKAYKDFENVFLTKNIS